MRETALRLTSRRPFAGMPGAQATARQRRRDRSVAASPGFTHRTVATARNRASGFGGDWRVRQQLPVGVGPDDRMPPGSREPKVRRQTGQHCSSQNQSSREKNNNNIRNSVIFRRTHIDAFFGRVISDAYERSQSDNGRFILLAQGRAPGWYRRRVLKD
ncbi:Uncharacterised protein [Escherichia coli]|nr:hypothetical protein [Escherichia coli]SQO93175.1 Uncharacterised protein [Escherichia coli]